MDAVQDRELDAHRRTCTPTWLLFKDGTLQETIVGVRAAELVAAITALAGPGRA